MVSWRSRAGQARDERGASMVEFALIAPIFIALVFGIISYGWMLSYRQGISQGASEAVRTIAVAPSGADNPIGDAREAVNRSLGSYGVECTEGGDLLHNGADVGSCTIVASESCGSAQCARVDIEHQYRDNPLIPSFPGLGVVLPQTVGYSTTAEINS